MSRICLLILGMGIIFKFKMKNGREESLSGILKRFAIFESDFTFSVVFVCIKVNEDSFKYSMNNVLQAVKSFNLNFA